MDAVKFYSILEKHLPPAALPYCFQLWQRYPFDFKLRKKRISKVGDFTCHQGKTPRITINHDSHPYLFLMTYVHEVAHLVVHQQHGWKIEAHGDQWKNTFTQLMAPVLTEDIYPEGLLKVLRRHMADPKASSFSDSTLTHAFRQYDERQKSVTLLSEIPEGSIFGLHGRWFKKGLLKRTRVICREINTKRNYLVPADVPIDSAQLSLL
ncbi:MAG: transcription elongation protein SprT [Cyclobacteriaceae bacterium]|nr:transcription elongation protein SprT [Cyclobacteriaceae bacterium]